MKLSFDKTCFSKSTIISVYWIINFTITITIFIIMMISPSCSSSSSSWSPSLSGWPNLNVHLAAVLLCELQICCVLPNLITVNRDKMTSGFQSFVFVSSNEYQQQSCSQINKIIIQPIRICLTIDQVVNTNKIFFCTFFIKIVLSFHFHSSC